MPTQSDRVYGALNATETTETKIGSINIPNGVKAITAIQPKVMQPTGTNGELISGQVRLSFRSVAGVYKFPAQVVGGQGAVGAMASAAPAYIPLNIPVPANEVVDVFAVLDVAVTGTATCETSLLME